MSRENDQRLMAFKVTMEAKLVYQRQVYALNKEDAKRMALEAEDGELVTLPELAGLSIVRTELA